MSKVVKIPDMFLKASAAAKRRQSTASIAEGESKENQIMTETSDNSIAVKKIKTEENKRIEVMEKSVQSSQSITTTISSYEPEADQFSIKSLLKCESWSKLLEEEFKKPYVAKIEKFLIDEYAKKKQVFPPRNEIFTAFNLIPFDQISVVVIGQDPYHDDNQAHGLSFSVKKGVKPPPSLKNIYKELESDIEGFKRPDHGYLVGWAKQGVFMLNATLTVRAHEANSHAKIGWQKFTDTVISIISKKSEKPIVFLLWGGFAHKKEELIDTAKHVIIKTAHPSPLSFKKWNGCKCFSKCNEELENNGRNPIDWNDL